MTDPTVNVILCPVDFSLCSEEAMRWAFALARTYGAEVHLVHADELPTYGLPEGSLLDEKRREDQREALRELAAARAVEGAPIHTELLHGKAPYQAIVDHAVQIGADIIVIGTHGRRGPGRVLLGSVAERVVRLSPVPVVTVRMRPKA